MDLVNELAALFRRDLTRLLQELEATPAEHLWATLPGTGNSVGNLALHLEGNLREFIGRQLGNVPYHRERPLEFSSRDVPKEELIRRLGEVESLIPGILGQLGVEVWESVYPSIIWGVPLSTQQTVLSLYAHLNYHLGQVDYLRRILTGGKAIEFANLAV